MKCPRCEGKTKVVDSREIEWRTKRKRICSECGHDFFTIEILRDEKEPRKKLKEKRVKRPCSKCYYYNLCTEEDMVFGERDKFDCYVQGGIND